MQNGHWLEKGAEATLPEDQANLLLMINDKVVLVEKIKRKRK